LGRKKTNDRTSKGQRTRSVARISKICLEIGVCLFLLCSCFSFDIGDWPSKYAYPQNNPPVNLCGSIGAFCAYYLLYFIGPGIFFILTTILIFLSAELILKPVNQPVLRSIGLVLVTIAASASFFCFWPHRIFNFPAGSGGVIGIATVKLLSNHFASVGMFIMVSAIWLVGAILLADNIIFAMTRAFILGAGKTIGIIGPPAWSAARQHSQAINEIWQKLSARQKPVSVAVKQSYQQSEEEYDSQLESELDAQCDSNNENISPPRGEFIIKNREMSINKPPAPVPAVKVSKPSPNVPPKCGEYVLPPLDLLAEPEYGYAAVQEKIVKSKATSLEKLLSEFNINARVVAADTGPVITMFELELAAGVKVSQITALSNDMARALGVGAIRVVAPLPGKHTIGIEVPNSEKEKVRIKSLIATTDSKIQKMFIPLFLGKDSSGEALVSDLSKMPHLLIAGTTGSGKSVCINSIITGILLTKRPDEVQMILIDPKMVEMTGFNTIPHLMCPIVTETQMVTKILEWATVKMDERYALLAEAKVKNIEEFNKLGADEIKKRFNPSCPEEEAKIPKKLPYIVIIIDELADLMMTAGKEIEAFIVRLAQKSRAIGIHIVLATQRPQATVVTGLIKSNMPCRIGFRVAARMDSRIILDQNGAETLLGEGDMLFLKPGTSELIRAQGTFMDDGEIRAIVKYLKDIAEPQFHPELTQIKKIDPSEMIKDDMFDEGVRVVLESQRGSVSLLQRRLNIGYARASRMIEMMASSGILGEYKGSQAREVLMTLDEYERIREQMDSQMSETEQQENHDEPAYVNEGQQEYLSTDNDNQDD
jgi:DNA segregation ATPase FtsK/SpoIIIE, S-DNA-T family